MRDIDEEEIVVGVVRVDLLGGFEIDLEQADLPFLHNSLDLASMGAVVVPIDLPILHEDIFVGLLQEGVNIYKVVLSAMQLALPRLAGGVADTELEDVGELVEQILHQCALPHARTAAHDEGLVPGEGQLVDFGQHIREFLDILGCCFFWHC